MADTEPIGRQRGEGPKVVALGGGHGLAAALKSARMYASEITGVVSVADDGGSSGRLREELGIPAPGDIRRCLSALAGEDSILATSLEHRFDQGALEGHPVGNLLIAGLAEASGDFAAAIREVARLVRAEGTLVPATVGSVTLAADSDAGVIEGQVTIERATGIHRLRFVDGPPQAFPAAVSALLNADQVILGPGSLYTSVLATAIVPEINAALLETAAQLVFVANVANDRAEARGFGLKEHLGALDDHDIVPDVVLVANGFDQGTAGMPVFEADIAAGDGWSHEPSKLAGALQHILR